MKELMLKERISRSVKISLTTGNIAEKLLHIMKSHIGYENAISRKALFHKVFGKAENEDSLEDWLRWEFVKKGMHHCRVRTRCFISSCRTDDFVFKYFVVNSVYDAEHYIKTLDNCIKKMRFMQDRCRKAGIEKWGSLPDWNMRGYLK